MQTTPKMGKERKVPITRRMGNIFLKNLLRKNLKDPHHRHHQLKKKKNLRDVGVEWNPHRLNIVCRPYKPGPKGKKKKEKKVRISTREQGKMERERERLFFYFIWFHSSSSVSRWPHFTSRGFIIDWLLCYRPKYSQWRPSFIPFHFQRHPYTLSFFSPFFISFPSASRESSPVSFYTCPPWASGPSCSAVAGHKHSKDIGSTAPNCWEMWWRTRRTRVTWHLRVFYNGPACSSITRPRVRKPAVLPVSQKKSCGP